MVSIANYFNSEIFPIYGTFLTHTCTLSTLTLPHHHTFTPSYPHTFIPSPSHPHTFTPSYPHTFIPSHPHTLTPSQITPTSSQWWQLCLPHPRFPHSLRSWWELVQLTSSNQICCWEDPVPNCPRDACTACKNHMKKIRFHSYKLVWGKVVQKFSKIKQVSANSAKVCRDQCLEYFCSKGRTSYIVRKSKIWWAHLPCWENCMLLIVPANENAYFSFRMANYFRKLHKKHSIRTAESMISLSIASSDCRVHVILSYPSPPLPPLGSKWMSTNSTMVYTYWLVTTVPSNSILWCTCKIVTYVSVKSKLVTDNLWV